MKLAACTAALLGAITATACANAPAVEPGLAGARRLALADAAQRSGLAAAALQVLSAEVVTWPDGAIGCPQPGRMYTQALVPGYRIRIQAGGELMHYHATSTGPPSFCPAAQARPPLAPDLRR